jgi:hypothetical protein
LIRHAGKYIIEKWKEKHRDPLEILYELERPDLFCWNIRLCSHQDRHSL